MASQKLSIEKELRRCAADFRYFCRYLQIVDKKARLVPLKLNEAHSVLISAIE